MLEAIQTLVDKQILVIGYQKQKINLPKINN